MMVSPLDRLHYENNPLDRLDSLESRVEALEHTELSGVAGPQGPTGATGATGATGPVGPVGPQGDPGELQADGAYEITGQWEFTQDLRSDGKLALGGQTTAVVRGNAFTLADEASANLRADGGLTYGIVVIICTSDVSVCVAGYDNATGYYIISDPRDRYRVTDTDGYHCLLVSGADGTLKNRRGVARSYGVHLLGMA